MDQERAKIIMVMWLIWHSQNKWKHDEELNDPVFSLFSQGYQRSFVSSRVSTTADCFAWSWMEAS
jgi:hypothetical protein